MKVYKLMRAGMKTRADFQFRKGVTAYPENREGIPIPCTNNAIHSYINLTQLKKYAEDHVPNTYVQVWIGEIAGVINVNSDKVVSKHLTPIKLLGYLKRNKKGKLEIVKTRRLTWDSPRGY